MNATINRHEHILQRNTLLKELFPTNSFIAANKRAKNLRELVARVDPYNIKTDLLNQTDHGYKKCGRKCDSCNSFVLEKTSFECFATRTKFRIRRDSTCDTKNVIYLFITLFTYCKKCNKQGVGSCIEWKPRLRNYKSHIKNKNPTCRIVKHFIDDCNDSQLPFKYLGFLIIDVLNNVEIYLKMILRACYFKQKIFGLGLLVTQHRGLNGSHDWNRHQRIHRDM